MNAALIEPRRDLRTFTGAGYRARTIISSRAVPVSPRRLVRET